MLPTVMMAIGFVVAWQFYIRKPDLPVELARQHEGLYRFLLNKWYFDELYDFIFVRPAQVARPLPVEAGRRLADRRLRAGRRVGARARRDAQCRAGADRLPLSLCLLHADRRRCARHLVHVRDGNALMASWPILSITTFLPLVGALFIMLLSGDDEAGKRNARWVALWTTLVTFAVSLMLVRRFDALAPNSSSSRSSPGSAARSTTTWASTAFRCRS